MTWLLILTLSGPDGTPLQVRAGILATDNLCAMAGEGITTTLEASVQGLTASWTCTPIGEAA